MGMAGVSSRANVFFCGENKKVPAQVRHKEGIRKSSGQAQEYLRSPDLQDKAWLYRRVHSLVWARQVWGAPWGLPKHFLK